MNFKTILIFIFSLSVLYSCGSSRKSTTKKHTTAVKKKQAPKQRTVSNNKLRNNLVNTAKKYNGVKYKAAGTTKAGMDCSGLVYTVFQENDIDFEAETTIRREILPNGKSRAFVNDTPVVLSVLSELATYLIDVHSQHQTRSISETAFQFEVLDTLAKNQNNFMRKQYY